ncbi:MAG TPA: serine--tRNA ligase [Anaerolineae bacterium]|nr:serine--tRNA ligase [Anaerolineae bacterium]
MIDIKLIREQADWVKAQVAKRNDNSPIDEILAADERRREIIVEVELLRQERNKASKEIGQVMGKLKKLEKQAKKATGEEQVQLNAEVAALQAEAEAAKERPRQIGEQISAMDEELRQVEASWQENMLWVPNMPHDSVPVGNDEEANLFHEPQGPPEPTFTFEPKAHWDIGTDLDIIDFERGVKLSGSRFYLLKKNGARLQRALIQFMLDMHVNDHGYEEIYPPFVVRSAMFEAAGQLPKFFDNIYRDAEEDLMLLATAEVALTNIHRDEIFEESDLPLRYVAYTPCFRREKMSAGKDVRGIKRGHQFDKVEMYQLVKPEDSYAILEQMKQHAIDICEALGFRYRIVELATGDISYASAKTYDIEIWAAGCQEWLEVCSASNCTDFQARRANIRYRPEDGSKNQFVHTLNASGLALPRVVIGILENYQQEDGSVIIPEALRPYMGGLEILR